MKKVAALGVIIIFSLQFFGCASKQNSDVNGETKNSQRQEINNEIAGGWNVTEVNQEVKDALAFAMQNETPNLKLKKILSAKSQVVNGINYNITYQLADNEIWNVTVYKSFAGNYSVTQNPEKVR